MSNMQGLTLTEIKRYKHVLRQLQKIPIVKQKTLEWYELRQNMITASDFAQALGEGKFGTQNQLIIKKCQPVADGGGDSKSNIFFKWGNLFEPIACTLYSMMHDNIPVHEFGLLQHNKYKFFGASPDGISDIGVMLEIKCPFKRKIIAGGDVPTQYYYQIQGQLDVCGLEVCDYFECEFEKSEDCDNFDDSEGLYIDRFRGVMIDFKDRPTLYGPILKPYQECSEQLKNWASANMRDRGDIIYWSLVTWNEKRVRKDQEWVNSKLKELEKVWEKILYYRNNPEALKLDIAKTISIDTEVAFPNKIAENQKSDYTTTLSRYAFRDLDDE